MKKNRLTAASLLLAGVLLLSGCGEKKSTFVYPEDYQRVAAVKSPVITESTEAGNSGEVKLESGDIYAVISVKDYGDIKVKLYPDEAPYAVQNFIDLALAGTYEGRTFHRVISGFMAQGGSADGKGSGGDSFEGGAFKNEINTSLRHYYGALCYASAMGDMSDQFYIVNNKEANEGLSELYEQFAQYYLYKFYENEAQKEEYAGDEFALARIQLFSDFYSSSVEGAMAMRNTITDAVTEKYKKGGTPSLDGGYTVFGQTVEGFEVLDKISSVETIEGSDGQMSSPVEDIIISSVTICTAE